MLHGSQSGTSIGTIESYHEINENDSIKHAEYKAKFSKATARSRRSISSVHSVRNDKKRRSAHSPHGSIGSVKSDLERQETVQPVTSKVTATMYRKKIARLREKLKLARQNAKQDANQYANTIKNLQKALTQKSKNLKDKLQRVRKLQQENTQLKSQYNQLLIKKQYQITNVAGEQDLL